MLNQPLYLLAAKNKASAVLIPHMDPGKRLRFISDQVEPPITIRAYRNGSKVHAWDPGQLLSTPCRRVYLPQLSNIVNCYNPVGAGGDIHINIRSL
jgi:hypothetical protein